MLREAHDSRTTMASTCLGKSVDKRPKLSTADSASKRLVANSMASVSLTVLPDPGTGSADIVLASAPISFCRGPGPSLCPAPSSAVITRLSVASPSGRPAVNLSQASLAAKSNSRHSRRTGCKEQDLATDGAKLRKQ